MNKKAENMLYSVVIYFLLLILFTVFLFLFLNRVGSQATVIEQIYAKQIALGIDKTKSGSVIKLDITNLYEIAEKNRVNGNIIDIDNNGNEVRVKLVNGKGYKHYFFSNLDVVWNLEEEDEIKYLVLEIYESGGLEQTKI